ncbi:hypothetical protein V3C99_012002 [Haemonchus contortus]
MNLSFIVAVAYHQITIATKKELAQCIRCLAFVRLIVSVEAQCLSIMAWSSLRYGIEPLYTSFTTLLLYIKRIKNFTSSIY